MPRIVVTICIILKADVTVLMSTFRTCHVIASFELVSSYFTLWAEFGAVLDFPAPELSVNLSTLFAWMRSLATFKTNSLAAFTCGCFLESTNFLNVAVAAYTRAPLQPGVYVNVDIPLELKVLLVDFLWAESTNIIVFEHFTAANSHTGDFYDISVADFYLKMFGETALAEFVIARKAEESV